jgi:uncharacterized membrane protein
MTSDKKQLKLEKELKSRLDWYYTLQDKTLKQITMAPGSSIRKLLFQLIQYLEKTAIPTVQRLIETIGEWSRIDAVEFYNANAEVSRLSEEIIYFFGYFHFFVAAILVMRMDSKRKKIITITTIYGIAIVMNIIGFGFLGMWY